MNIFKKFLCIILCVSFLTMPSQLHAWDWDMKNTIFAAVGGLVSAYCLYNVWKHKKLAIKKAGNYILSKEGAKDLALAYGVGMGLTTIHELGHAVTAKVLFGTPIQLVIGAAPGTNRSYLRVGGISLGGFNPATGYATTGYHGDQPLKVAAMLAAGPICGALSSLAVLLLLRQCEGLYMTKAAAAYGLFNHTIGIAGVGGAWTPGTDVNRIVKILKNYRAS